jgi:hypothetical protein
MIVLEVVPSNKNGKNPCMIEAIPIMIRKKPAYTAHTRWAMYVVLLFFR